MPSQRTSSWECLTQTGRQICALFDSSREAQKVEQRSRVGGLLWERGQWYQGPSSQQVNFGAEAGEMGISIHNMQFPFCATGCAPHQLEIKKREETSVLLLEKCPHTTGDIWQDGRSSNLLSVLIVPTAVVAGTPNYVPAESHPHPFPWKG